MDEVERLLAENGPMLSGTLTLLVSERSGLSAVAARKRLSRHAGIRRLEGLPFARNARFIYLQKQYGAPEFWSALTSALTDNAPAYSGALGALRARGGIMPVAHFEIACGCPDAQKKQLSSGVVLNRLMNANLVDRFDVEGVGPCVALSQRIGHDHEIAQMRARLIAEGILLVAVSNWAKKLALVSYGKVALRDDPTSRNKVGTFRWDFSAPSYLRPLRSWKAEKMNPGFVVCDVLLGNQVDEDAVRPFIRKCEMLGHLKGVSATLPIFLTDRFHESALRLAKEAGVVPATVENLFSEAVAKGLRELIEVLKHAAYRTDPETVGRIFESLSSIEGAATNLRGALFHYIAAELVRQSFGQVSDMGRIFTRPATETKPVRKAEADIIAEKPRREVLFIECKGYKPTGTISDEEVDRWLDVTIPILREAALDHPDWKNSRHHFSFWTTARLSPASRARLVMVCEKTKKYEVSFKDNKGISSLADEVRDRSLKQTLQEHFLGHPFERIERDVERRRSASLQTDQSHGKPMDDTEGDLDDIPF